MDCLLLFSVGSVQSSIRLSVGFRVYSVQCQFSVCSVQGVYRLVGHSPSVLFSVCSVQSTGCSPRVSCSCHVQSPHLECPLPLRSSWILTSRQPQRTKYNVKWLFFKSTYLSLHNDTFWYGFIFGRYSRGESTKYLSALGSQQGILISASSVSHCGSPVWKNGPCSEYQFTGPLEEHCSNYIINLCQC